MITLVEQVCDFGLTNLFNTFFFTLGKASRMLAAKAALACRADALFESLEANNKDKDVKFDPEWIEQRERMNKGELGLEGRTKVETRIRILEGGHSLQVCLFVYFAIIQSTFRLFKGQQYLNNM